MGISTSIQRPWRMGLGDGSRLREVYIPAYGVLGLLGIFGQHLENCIVRITTLDQLDRKR